MSTMIEAFIVEDITEELSASQQALAHTLERMNEEQPWLLAYIFSEEFEVFTDSEREVLLFLTSVIWKTVFQVWGEQEQVNATQLAAAEERNWATLQTTKASNFRDRLTPFFAEHPEEEELLALVEDTIVDDVDSPVSAEGREALFITLKSMIDCLVLPNL
ncbi:MAG: hypothetical protein AAGJ82_03960 [Bacteroidota bacterium]